MYVNARTYVLIRRRTYLFISTVLQLLSFHLVLDGYLLGGKLVVSIRTMRGRSRNCIFGHLRTLTKGPLRMRYNILTYSQRLGLDRVLPLLRSY